MKRFVSFVIVPAALALLGCGSASEAQKTPRPRATDMFTEPEPTFNVPPLVYRLKGSDVKAPRAILNAYGKNSLELVFGPDSLDCKSPRKSYETSLLIDHVLQPDGSLAWKIRQVNAPEEIRSGDYGVPTITGDTAKSVGITLPSIAFDAKGSKALELSGGVVAKGCGDIAKNPAAPRPQTNVALRAGPLELPVFGALVLPDPDGNKLIVSTNPIDCSGRIVEGEDLRISLSLGKTEDGDPRAYVDMGGALLGTHSSSSLSRPETFPKLTFGPVKGEIQRVTVSFDSEGRFKLEGNVDALVCPVEEKVELP